MMQPASNKDMSSAEACMYLVLGGLLNFVGLLLSAVVGRGMTPCLLGFAFSFSIYDILIWAFSGLGYPIGVSLVTVFFIIIIYYRYRTDQESAEGNWADFAFFFVLGLVSSVLGLFFGFFQSRRKGSYGAALGFFLNLCGISIYLIVDGAAYTALTYLIIAGVFYICLSIAMITVIIIKMIKGDPDALGFVTFLLLSAMFGPLGVLAAILHPHADSKFGGIFGMFCWIAAAGVVLLCGRSFLVGSVLLVFGIVLCVALVFMLARRKAEPPAPAANSSWFNPQSTGFGASL
ncbi:hypothetical protein PAPYR_6830 [Paratrimastix pyriformis]|uniref:DUF4203 domain-containing protein n=1 Tax=Paratrimastix pyriformis TaxID=342808 RepID=A0ABQ8UGZ8_9EUKA|nr:hypothetical protein PAPYR_6830 [Paratrimastix pyriformis]